MGEVIAEVIGMIPTFLW